MTDLLSAAAVKEQKGLSRYMLDAHGPAPVQIGVRRFWRKADLDAWLGTENDGPRSDDLMGRINGLSADEIR